MQSFNFYMPTEIAFGKGTEEKVADLMKKHGGTKALIVYGGGSVVRSGLLEKTKNLLRDAGIDYVAYGGVHPNPRLSHTREGIQTALKFGADFVLCVGGGSSIDEGKGIALGVANPDIDIWEFWSHRVAPTKCLPVATILTIAAAGSETSNSAVITNEDTGDKWGFSTDLFCPKFSIMNPELTFTLPKYHIAAGTVDMMMHTFERYFTLADGNEITDGIAESVLRTIIENGPKAQEYSHDYAAMSELMWGGSVAHNGITGLGGVGDWATHDLGHELSAKFDIAHGASLAVIWPAWAEHVYMQKPERFARFAEKVWGIWPADTVEETAVLGIARTVEYFKSLGMPTSFSETDFGVQEDSVLKEFADKATFYGQRTQGNFLKLDTEACYEIYKKANH